MAERLLARPEAACKFTLAESKGLSRVPEASVERNVGVDEAVAEEVVDRGDEACEGGLFVPFPGLDGVYVHTEEAGDVALAKAAPAPGAEEVVT